MKRNISILLVVAFLMLACQLLAPGNGGGDTSPDVDATPGLETPEKKPGTDREGTMITDCSSIVQAVDDLHPVEPPKSLAQTGVKTGNEFDVNQYFKVLPYLSMQEGYTLDYVYSVDFLGSLPLLYARPVDQPPYPSMADLPEGMKLGDYREHLQIEDVEQGYFEYAVMDMLAGQFYLVWHANYKDDEIVCNADAAGAIVDAINAGDFGYKLDLNQKAQVRAMTDIEPVVRLTEESAIVELVTFTKWGGFFRRTYTISRSFPHTVEINQETLVEYDCGVMF